MASSTCHVVGGTKRVRLERFVRRDHPAEMTARQGRLNRSLENRAHPANCQRRNPPKPHPLGRQCHRVHAPHGITEADERTVATLECATQEVTEAGGPKPATIGVEGPPDITEAENRFSSRFDAPNA